MAALPALLITRPAEEQERTCAAARAAGFQPVSAPLLRMEDVAFSLPASLPPALLFTSARAPGPAARQYPQLRELPVYAVGHHSAGAARAAGFRVRMEGARDGSAIVAAAAEGGEARLLHLTGADHAALDVPAGLSIERRTVYRAVAAGALPDAAVSALRRGALALLLSPRTAAIFARLFDAAGLPRDKTGLALISRATAAGAGPGWRAVAVAEQPDLRASLAAAQLLWHKQQDG